MALSLKTGAVPAEVTAGRSVALVPVAASAGSETPTGPLVLVGRAQVLSVQSDPSSGSVVLSVQVASSAAPRVAQLAAVGGVWVGFACPAAP